MSVVQLGIYGHLLLEVDDSSMLDEEIAEFGFAALFYSGWVRYVVIGGFIGYLRYKLENGKSTQGEHVTTV
jgi:hypothetical protein